MSPRASTLKRQAAIAVGGVVALAAGTAVVSRISRRSSRLKQTPEENAAQLPISSDGVVKTDVLVVGTGGAALTAALRARSLGLTTLVIDKSPKIGGTSCYSGSGCWIPNTHLHNDKRDSVEKALTYMENIIGDAGPASSPERKRTFLETGPKMVRWLEENGYRWHFTPGYPDYFPDQPGWQLGGRSIEADMFDSKQIGEWRHKLNINPARAPLPLYTHELTKIVRASCSWDGRLTAAKIWGGRLWPQRFLGGEPVCLGVSMISQLIYLNVSRGTTIWTDAPLKELKVENGRVTGAFIEKDGKPVTVEASRGVILAAGGFAKNPEMRKLYQADPITTDWTSACPTDQGDAITAAVKAGAATALMDSAWWGASVVDPKSKVAIWCLYDRGLPHSMIVNQKGQRFLNESQNYNALGTKLWEAHKKTPSIPSYIIIDSNHRSRYLLSGRYRAGTAIPQDALDSGFVYKADTIADLARTLNIDGKNLQQTVERFNRFADQGLDEDFQRGSNQYDAFIGDPDYEKNHCLGRIEKGPFYALKIWPGDLGTKGGVLTDERARALKEVGSGKYEVIPGLYAVGNNSASVMGRTYAGAGSTLGPGLTFGYIAATDCAEGGAR
ncbi:hypothetical protein NLU13_6626 [Sarocladium strictum]|uniref:FAD-dependent oxidoreductase 2 FAD-binding domain-containing protein n=1 Tax=Sarocladium strictum TaxID=5046 RepID=A0AA39GG93_SARSR|nr:hypothetical protein NLU13_6626 [Sarocladium strictum]